jgi:hypothetical protein
MNGRVITQSLPRGFRAALTRPHDGDSFWMLCDTGFDGRHEPELRLLDVHAPELSQPGGHETTSYVNGWLATHSDPTRHWPFWVDVVRTRTFEPEMKTTFTRYVATVWQFDDNPDGTRSATAGLLTLNTSVTLFLSGHPEWPSGE